MKKLLKYSFILITGLISSNALAEWTIPGNRCVPGWQFMLNEIGYDRAAIQNLKVRSSASNASRQEVVCATPAHLNFGSKLDMEFVVENNSDDQDFLCMGWAYGVDGYLNQETARVSTGKGRVTLKASFSRSFDDGEAVTVTGACYLPDRGVNGKHTPSKLISVRVF